MFNKKEYSKKWRENNKEKCIEAAKKWYRKNHKKVPFGFALKLTYGSQSVTSTCFIITKYLV